MARDNLKLIAVGALVLLNACSIWQPYVDRRRNAGNPPENLYVGRSTINAPSICYNGLTADFDEIQKMADEVCVDNKTGDFAEVVSKEAFSCKIFIPSRINFKCVKKNISE